MSGTVDDFDLGRLQKRLASRVLLIFLLPCAIAAVLVVFIFVLTARVKEAELAIKLVNIERVWTKDKNYQWAIDEYTRLARQSSRPEVLVRLGALQLRLDPPNTVAALETLERAKRMDPGYWETYSTLSYAYVKTNHAREAIAEGEAALRLNPADAQTYNNLAWVYATSADPAVRDLDKAKVYAESAVRLTRETQPAYLDTLAEVYARRGERQRAAQQLRKAIAISPNATAPPLRARLEQLTGEKT